MSQEHQAQHFIFRLSFHFRLSLPTTNCWGKVFSYMRLAASPQGSGLEEHFTCSHSTSEQSVDIRSRSERARTANSNTSETIPSRARQGGPDGCLNPGTNIEDAHPHDSHGRPVSLLPASVALSFEGFTLPRFPESAPPLNKAGTSKTWRRNERKKMEQMGKLEALTISASAGPSRRAQPFVELVF